jgi:hypothetical protein
MLPMLKEVPILDRPGVPDVDFEVAAGTAAATSPAK